MKVTPLWNVIKEKRNYLTFFAKNSKVRTN
ncbi:hypothetical protein DFP94_10664 [Fontibacillus phaseoli]|uniref:Uncharacterized protein n=1 Tax=Fontibacillus phaseoli TaxID=1416533 RepID=A0A369BAU6_9BACL|nr:hypothetical protein DFP94_10664 [Fontibacillus phaseoli]